MIERAQIAGLQQTKIEKNRIYSYSVDTGLNRDGQSLDLGRTPGGPRVATRWTQGGKRGGH